MWSLHDSAAEVPGAQHIHADAGNENEQVIDDDISDDTESLRSSLLLYLKENGRAYHRYRSDAGYILPEDKREQERYNLQHGLFLFFFQERLHLAPLDKHVQDVLDLGTGTGIWAIDFADQYPEANVVGIDISPIQPTSVPPNCKFELDDFDSEWLYTTHFDYIHARWLNIACQDYPTLFQRSLQQLKPGGWFELQDTYLPMLCDDGTDKGTNFEEWSTHFLEGIRQTGKDPGAPSHYKEWMEQAGFENIIEKVYKWPINSWPKDKRMKEVGDWNLVNMIDGLEGFSVRLFTKVLGWSMEELDTLLNGVKRDLQDKRIHCYWRIYVVYGRKPK